MSVWATAWAWEVEVGSGGAKLVLLALADFADERGECWPAQETLGRMTEQDPRTVRRHLLRLSKKDIVARSQRCNERGERISDFYRLLAPANRLRPEARPADKSSGGAKPSGQKWSNQRTNPADKLSREPLKLNHQEPPQENRGGGDCLIQDLISPKGLSNDEKAKALGIVSRLPPVQAQAVLDEMEGAVRSNRIKSNRLGWLRKVAESARQGTFSPELGIRVVEERRLRVQREAQTHAPQAKSWQEELIDQELERKATSARASPARCAGMDARACPGTDGDPVS